MRDYYEVVPNRMAFGLLGWRLTRRGIAHKKVTLNTNKNKDVLCKLAAAEAAFWWEKMKWPGEVVIKNKWGRIQRRDTYGLDPKLTKG